MPWRWEAMKGVVSCDKPRGAAACFDPGMPEWGNPTGVMSRHPLLNTIGREGQTGGSEPSQYPQEEKATAIPGVAASETGTAQTGGVPSVRALHHRCRGTGLDPLAWGSGSQKPAR